MDILNKNKKTISTQKGFTLLVAIVVTSLLLIVGFVVSNVALKQIVLADAVVESQYAFYNADSGADCAVYWDLKNGNNGVSPFSTSTAGTISCRGSINIITNSQTNIATNPVSSSVVGGGGSSNSTSIFQVDYEKGCAIVRVTKQNDGYTTVDSRGYNTCDTSSRRRYERGLTLTYIGNENTILGVTGNSASLGSISRNPTSLSFSANVGVVPASKTVTITNTGTGNITDLSATPDAGWCHVSLSSQTLNSGGSVTATVSVDASGSPGTYTCNIPIASTNANNSPVNISVTDTVTSQFVCATGGTVTYSGNYEIHTFTYSNPDKTLTVTCPGSIDYLIVGGGGGGGNNDDGGGGGGGGVIAGNNVSISNGAYAITVGNGGTGGNNGGSSSFKGNTSIGGGAGGSGDGGSGSNGASGGGAAWYANPSYGIGTQGYNGGSGNGGGAGGHGGGGGGGAGGQGGNAGFTGQDNGGNGGPGISSSISGSAITYGGGGGGAGDASGGFGGGAGGRGSGHTSGVGRAGTDNTGNGGGASIGTGSTGFSGGTGVVIVRFLYR